MYAFSLASFFFFNDTATTEIYTLSLHDALPISDRRLRSLHRRRAPDRLPRPHPAAPAPPEAGGLRRRSEEHTSELQSQSNLVCRLLLEKKKSLLAHELKLHSLQLGRCIWDIIAA